MSESNTPVTPESAVTPEPSARTCRSGRRSRSRRWIKVSILLVALGGLFAAGSAFADRHRSRGELNRERLSWVLEKFNDKVDGSDAQLTSLEAIADEHFPALLALHTEGKVLRGQLAEALLADKPDARKVETLRKQVVSLVDRGTLTLSAALLEASGVLTAEQKQELYERLSDRFGR